MRILVYGATGFTGTLVVHTLLERGFSVVLSGRDPARLEALAREHADSNVEVRPARIHDDQSLRQAIDGSDLVINCAGPFLRIGEPVLAAAIDRGVRYVDTTGEQAFMRDMYERYESRARKAGVVVVNGLAFEITLGDLCAHLAARALLENPDADEADEADEIAVAYAFSRFRTSAGTQLSGVESLAAPGCVWSGRRWDPVAPAAEHRLVDFGPTTGARSTLSFPSGEVITVPRHCRARRVQTFLSLADAGPFGDLVARFTPVVSPFLPMLLGPLAALARSYAGTGKSPPSDLDRSYSMFSIVAEARRGDECERVLVTGADPYGVTAQVLGLAAERLGPETEVVTGVRAPAEVFPAADMLAEIAERASLEVHMGPEKAE